MARFLDYHISKANEMTQSPIFPFISITIATFLTCFGLEMLLDITEYDVYRVLDINLLTVSLTLLFLLAQFLSIKWLISSPIVHNFRKLIRDNQTYLPIGFVGVGSFCYYLLSENTFSWLIFIGIFLAICALLQLSGYLKKHYFVPLIITLLGIASLDASFVFWLHETQNEGLHESYAKTLAEKEDVALLKVVDNWSTNQKLSEGDWEKKWLTNDYLSSNYSFTFEDKLDNKTLGLVQKDLTTYQVGLPNGTITLTANNTYEALVYRNFKPFKNLEKLPSFLFAVVKNDKITASNTNDFDEGIMDIPLPPLGTIEKVHWQGYDARVFHHRPGSYVLIGEPLSEFQVWTSNFAFIFCCLLLVIIALECVSLIGKKSSALNWNNYSLEFKVQSLLVGLTITLFYVIASATFTFLAQNNKVVVKHDQIEKCKTIRSLLADFSTFDKEKLHQVATGFKGSIDWYTAAGNLAGSSFASLKNSPAQKIITPDILSKLKKNQSAILTTNEVGIHPYYRSYFKASDNPNAPILAYNVPTYTLGSTYDIPIIMGKLLSVYVLLLLLAWCIGLALVNVLTKPLQWLSNKLKNFELGEQNETLNWRSDDAIGQLVHSYNKMVVKVEKTSQELMEKEREGAWQVMAQQIAHEINNHLTPLRLNIQYLSVLLKSPQQSGSVDRITQQLVEKVDQLSDVSRQFRLFANLEAPSNEPMAIVPFLEDFVAPYLHDETYTFSFKNNIKEGGYPSVIMEADHLKQVLQNIVENAQEAISGDELGKIDITVTENNEQLMIDIKDNGCGIDPSAVKNIFTPTFSVDNSQTGLGLAICQRIIQFYKGQISFETEKDKGTTFSIALNLVKQIDETHMLVG